MGAFKFKLAVVAFSPKTCNTLVDATVKIPLQVMAASTCRFPARSDLPRTHKAFSSEGTEIPTVRNLSIIVVRPLTFSGAWISTSRSALAKICTLGWIAANSLPGASLYAVNLMGCAVLVRMCKPSIPPQEMWEFTLADVSLLASRSTELKLLC